jgi:hypothetical protein
LPAEIRLESVRQVVYRSNYWALDVTPIEGVSMSGVRRAAHGEGVAYTGTLVNRLDVALSDPAVVIFPLNPVGRPLAAAYGSSALEVPAGGSWDFETDVVSDIGTDQAAFPAHGP